MAMLSETPIKTPEYTQLTPRMRHLCPRLCTCPLRLRYFMQRDEAVLNMVLRIFLRVMWGRSACLAGSGG